MIVLMVIVIIVFGPVAILLAAKHFMAPEPAPDFERWEHELRSEIPWGYRARASLDQLIWSMGRRR